MTQDEHVLILADEAENEGVDSSQLLPSFVMKLYEKKEIFKMNKTSFIREITKNVENYTQKEVAEILDAAQKVLTDALVAGEKVSFVGFGSFETTERAARVGRNPQTGEEISIPASKLPKFKAGKAFKEAIKNS